LDINHISGSPVILSYQNESNENYFISLDEYNSLNYKEAREYRPIFEKFVYISESSKLLVSRNIFKLLLYDLKNYNRSEKSKIIYNYLSFSS